MHRPLSTRAPWLVPTLTCLAAASVACAQDQYLVSDLGSLGPTPFAQASAVNAWGHVVGYSFAATSPWPHAFLYANGQMTDLGTFPGTVTSFAKGINASDQIIGWSQDLNGTTINWLWQNGSFTALPMSAGGINDAGMVAGAQQVAPGSWHLILWNGAAADYGDIGGSQLVVNGLNNQGSLSGWRWSMPSYFSKGGAVADIGDFFQGNYAYAYAMNDHDDVVGQGTAGFEGFGFTWEAFLYHHGVDYGTAGYETLGSLTPGGISSAEAVNNHQQVVGYSTVDGIYSGINHAFIWQLGTMDDLNEAIDPASPVAGDLIMARGINDQGQIVVNGSWGYDATINRFIQHAYLLTPATISPPNAVGLAGGPGATVAMAH